MVRKQGWGRLHGCLKADRSLPGKEQPCPCSPRAPGLGCREQGAKDGTTPSFPQPRPTTGAQTELEGAF